MKVYVGHPPSVVAVHRLVGGTPGQARDPDPSEFPVESGVMLVHGFLAQDRAAVALAILLDYQQAEYDRDGIAGRFAAGPLASIDLSEPWLLTARQVGDWLREYAPGGGPVKRSLVSFLADALIAFGLRLYVGAATTDDGWLGRGVGLVLFLTGLEVFVHARHRDFHRGGQ